MVFDLFQSSGLETVNQPVPVPAVDDDVLPFVFDGLVAFAGQFERGEQGTRHLQAVLVFSRRLRLNQVAAMFRGGAHVERCHDLLASVAYCTKETSRELGPWKAGELPFHRNNKRDWDAMWELAKAGKMEEIPADVCLAATVLCNMQVRIRCYSTIKCIAKDHAPAKPDLPELDNVWLYGAPGSGKSFEARRLFPGAYPKSFNKWWDGYQNEDTVIIDDFEKGDEGKNHPLGHHLKIWSDVYEFIAEIKGGAARIRPKRLIVTSNYSIDEVFPRHVDSALNEAVHRRFMERYWSVADRVLQPRAAAGPLAGPAPEEPVAGEPQRGQEAEAEDDE